MGVTTTNNKPINPRGNDQSPKGYNRASLFSGKALDFDGVNDTLSTDYAPNSNIQTTAYWVKLDSLTTNYALGGFVNGTTDMFGLYYWGNKSNKNFGFNSWNSDSYGIALPDFVDDWFHIVAEYNFTDFTQSKIFVNSQELSISQTLGTTLQRTAASRTFKIASPSTGAQEMNGKISGIKVFDVALTAAQVADLYNNPEKVVPTGVDNTALKLWLPMMEGAGTTAYDGSGNGNHGTISGATYVNGIGAPVAQTAVMDWNKGTNLLTYSERFGQWTQNDSSVSDNIESAPNGSTTADKWVIDSGENYTADVRQTISSQVGKDYLLFVFVKADEFNLFQLDTSNSQFSDVNVDFNLSTGSIVSSGGDNVTEGIIDKGNGWYLCYMVGTAIAGSGSFIIRNDATQTGDGSKGMYLWGGGYVQASDITPYIPTIGATAQTSEVLLPQGLTTGRDITGVNLFENVRKQGALNLDENSRASVHENASIDISDCSLEAWVCLLPYSSSGWKTIFSKVSQANLQIYLDNNDKLAHYNSTSSGGILYNTAFNENEWNHFICVEDGSDVRTYVNGVLQSTKTISLQMDSDGDFSIGSKPNILADEIAAQIAQPRIYNRALTAEEVQRNYNAGKNTYTN